MQFNVNWKGVPTYQDVLSNVYDYGTNCTKRTYTMLFQYDLTDNMISSILWHAQRRKITNSIVQVESKVLGSASGMWNNGSPSLTIVAWNTMRSIRTWCTLSIRRIMLIGRTPAWLAVLMNGAMSRRGLIQPHQWRLLFVVFYDSCEE